MLTVFDYTDIEEKTMEQLALYIPQLEDLWFYQKMMSDPETMAYSANWDVD